MVHVEQKRVPATATRLQLAKWYQYDYNSFLTRLRDIGINHSKKLLPKEIEHVFSCFGWPPQLLKN
jgi:hypothetical protein